MRCNWTAFTNKLTPVPASAHPDNAPDVVSSKAIPNKMRETINVATQLGAYIFILALACDGFNPWRGVQYTMWFLALRVLNLKIEHSARTDELITIGIIPGPREPKTLQHYANYIVLVKELLMLQANQVTVARSLDGGVVEQVLLTAFLIGLIGDYPAICKLLHVQGVGNQHTQIHNIHMFFPTLIQNVLKILQPIKPKIVEINPLNPNTVEDYHVIFNYKSRSQKILINRFVFGCFSLFSI
jgi:hypothetical protein